MRETMNRVTNWTGEVEEWGEPNEDGYAWRQRTVVRTEPAHPERDEKEYVYIADEESAYDPETGEWSEWAVAFNEGMIITRIPHGMSLVMDSEIDNE